MHHSTCNTTLLCRKRHSVEGTCLSSAGSGLGNQEVARVAWVKVVVAKGEVATWDPMLEIDREA